MAEISYPGIDPRDSTGPLKVAPHSVEAEQSVLGGLMLDPQAWDKVSDVVSEGDFYRQEHRLIFAAIARVFSESKPCDVVTVAEVLAGIKELDNVGGITYLNALAQNTPTAANIKAYADIVRERSILRQLIRIGTDISSSAYDTEGRTSAELLDQAEQRVFSVSDQHNKRGKGFIPIKELLKGAVDRIDMLYEQEDPYTGAPSGFNDLDDMTSGLQKSDLVIIAGRPSMGKCVEAGTEIVLEDGSVETIETLYHRRQANLLTLGEDWRLRFTSPSVYVDDGKKPVFRVTTRLGRSIETTATHPYLTPKGWRPLGELEVGEKVAVPRHLPVFGRRSMRRCELKLLGYLLGDGSLTQTTPRFTNVNPRMQDDFIAAVEEFGGLRATLKKSVDRAAEVRVAGCEKYLATRRERFAASLRHALDNAGLSGRRFAREIGVSPVSVWNWTHAQAVPGAEVFSRIAAFFSGEQAGNWLPAGWNTGNPRNPLSRWLEELGVWGKDAHGKFIPAPVFQLPRDDLALFINRLFATDGWATLLASGQGQLGFSTVSERMARQLQHLLLRFGIIAKLRPRQVKLAEHRHSAWQLDITDAESILVFAEEIGIFGKEAALDKVAGAVRGKRRQSNCDLIPVEFWEDIARAKGEVSWACLAHRAGIRGTSNIHVGRRALSRQRLARLAEALDDQNLGNLACSDVYWDEIVAIEYTGYRQVYDLTIPDTHNFVANDLCVHNTTFAMNVAENAAIKHQVPVGVFSMEMPGEQLALRMMSSLGHIDQHRIRTGKLHDEDWPRLTSAVSLLAEAPIFIDDTPALSPSELRSRCRRLKREHDLGMVVIDYLQLMQSPGYGDNRVNEISDISRNLKALAKELEIPVLALSQLNRGLEQRPNKRPVMSDLRESGAIEQDADVIVFIYRDEVYNEDSPDKGTAEIIIAKQRNGPIGTVRLTFLGKYTRFENFVPENMNYEGYE